MRFKVEFKRTISSILAVAMTFSITSVMPAVAEEAAKYPYAVFAADEAAQRTFRAANFRGKLCLRDLPGLHQILDTVTDFSGEVYLIHCCKRLLFRQNLSQICCMIFSSIAYNFHKV